LAASEPGEPLPASLAGAVARTVADRFDTALGRLAGTPKFPQAPLLLAHDGRAREMALQTLDAMADGGIHDQLGGGFHRYTVDHRWLVPHFEKMLYDNALLARAYAIGHAVTGRERYAQVA